MSEQKKLSVLLVRPLMPDDDGAVVTRALASLGGLADEVVTSDVHPHFPLCPAPHVVEGASVTTLTFGTEGLYAEQQMFVPDLPTSFGSILPAQHTGMLLPRYPSAIANVMASCASGEYVLLLDPAEVCLDPVNLVRTLSFLDSNPHVDVVSMEVKTYDDDTHVRTVTRPKLLRRGKAHFTGIMADDVDPVPATSHLLAASGLTFRDTSGASKERGLFELKICLARYLKDPSGAPVSLLANVARRLVDYAPLTAAVFLGDLLSRLRGRGSERALPLRLLGKARAKLSSYSTSATEAYDESLSVEASAEGYLWRGLHAFADRSLGRPWVPDLRRAVELGRPSNFYGMDLREVRRALQILAADSYVPPKAEPVGNMLDYVAKVDAAGTVEVQGSRDGKTFETLAPGPAELQGGVTREEFDETLAQANLPDSDPRKRD